VDAVHGSRSEEANKEIHGGEPRLPWIAERVTKVGGGHPTKQALSLFFGKVDADPNWYPGAHNGEKRGPAPLLTPAKRRCIAASAMRRLPRLLRGMLGADARLPRVVFTDRGTGMYTPMGRVVGACEAALQEGGFRTFWGGDASDQAADMPDLLLHETAVAIFRARMRKEVPACLPWQETPEQWTARARKVVRGINAECDLAGLCREFPARLQSCVDAQGDRLRK
jgi:hypothetical protein